MMTLHIIALTALILFFFLIGFVFGFIQGVEQDKKLDEIGKFSHKDLKKAFGGSKE
jgi:ABC-type dipeptide/oligopeptide/nickel transport system permease component